MRNLSFKRVISISVHITVLVKAYWHGKAVPGNLSIASINAVEGKCSETGLIKTPLSITAALDRLRIGIIYSDPIPHLQ
jgi:hypothetical protein